MVGDIKGTMGYIVASVVIGAVIGGGTNRLAIAMLFRPYRPLRIGSWTLPFTPGLIPKRRHELALQLGRTVREYLINGETLSRAVLNNDVQERIVARLKDSWDNVSLGQLIQRVTAMMTDEDPLSHLRIKDLVPSEWQHQFRSFAKTWSPELNRALVRFLKSARGEDVLRQFYGDWTQTQGWLGRLTGSILVEDKVVGKTRDWLVRRLESPHGYGAVLTVIEHGIEVFLEMHPSTIVKSFERLEEKGVSADKKLGAIVIECVMPNVLRKLASRGEQWLDMLQLDQLVTEQVETFSLRKLEDMIVNVAKKELSMITWLGALIGAFIGLCQGLLVIVMG